MPCTNEHRFLPDLWNLPESQAGAGRHLCAGCAYEQGYNHAFEGLGRQFDVTLLEESQAGAGRHRDVDAAYDLGYTQGTTRRLGQSGI